VVVAYFCIPSYSAGEDWENHSSRPGGENSSQEPISINKLGVEVCT
jgi:hypothetical protein